MATNFGPGCFHLRLGRSPPMMKSGPRGLGAKPENFFEMVTQLLKYF